ncbi:MAG: ParB/RepB/Spo0J family partition protein [Sphaerochaetaceae bacterium]
MSGKIKKKGLGKGISSLMEDYSYDAFIQAETALGEKSDALILLEINKIRPNMEQPRKKFDQETLAELAASIRHQGILQPLLVEKLSDDEFMIVAGERRYRAALEVGLEKVPVIVKTFNAVQRLEVSLIENIQRENLNPIDEAKAYLFLLEQANIRQEDLADRVGKKRSTISNSIRLLQLPDVMQDSLLRGEFSAGHARALLSVVNPADQQYLYQKIVSEQLSVRSSEHLAQELNHGKRAVRAKGEKPIRERSVDMVALEQKFIEKIGTKVQLKGTLKKGKIEISYYSMDDLDRIYRLLLQEEETVEL